MTKQGYWAVLPAEVRYDRELSATEKLLYAEMSALAQRDGYCWAKDSYFAELFGVSVPTVSRCIRNLKGKNYIQVEIGANAKGTERHIFCGAFGGLITSDKTLDQTPDDTITSDQTPLIKNDKTPCPTPYNKNNKKRKDRPACVREINEVFDEIAGDDAELRDMLDTFAIQRAEDHKPMTTEKSAKILAGKLKRYSGGDHATMRALLGNAIEHRWLTVYPLKADDIPATAPARTVEDAPDVREWRPGA